MFRGYGDKKPRNRFGFKEPYPAAKGLLHVMAMSLILNDKAAIRRCEKVKSIESRR